MLGNVGEWTVEWDELMALASQNLRETVTGFRLCLAGNRKTKQKGRMVGVILQIVSRNYTTPNRRLILTT